MTILILTFGFLFGAILQVARLNRFNVISGMATLENFTVAKAIAVAIGLGAILINVEIGMGFASYHIKPFLLGGIIFGGLIFGIGMAILGYCPGTLVVSFGEGSLDAFWGIIGGLLGGLVYTVLVPFVEPLLGPNLGSLSLYTWIGDSLFLFYLLVFVIGILFLSVAFLLNTIEHKKDWTWLFAGAALAVLNALVFLSFTTNRIIGASTTFPYLADWLSGTTNNEYFANIQKPGQWELLFLTGAFVSGVVISIIRKEFKLTLIHENWKKYKGVSSRKRIFWALVGGFILVFGARMAGGCTSGHVISGGMQIALSSLVFAVFVFMGLLITGRLFYKRKSRF